ncbi:hypothetical protein Ferpe_0449 [Fervidobacterium pennivorans DSM 9078]|uniref:Uncharacterized protein n=1 Tax=Fervidobacterium pennivorans (strain DSM 9078 / Ven5) TaxID=771875 RepID=H9UAP6_FERPD|nr:hypothetical protein [Fervidobacterium pennivorans]AFG34589.1 hypothetical protein Ferpe_0449 [Fervidobacterium pennivorans DSM 9078]QIV77913.1 hypothetical protein HER11_02200 [Fervidobacterium pennivorans subsp. keratinolyticus]
MKRVIVMIFSVLVFINIFAGSVQLNGRVEFNYTINPDFSLAVRNWFPGDNAAYLVVTSGGAVLVVDVKYTAPNITSMYVNELFMPWKVNSNLTVFFGYRNVADYNSFMGSGGSFKWAYNGTGILWYKSTVSFIYTFGGFMFDVGTNFGNPLTFALLMKTNNFYPLGLTLNVVGKADLSEGLVGARLAYPIRPFTLYLASGYDYVNATIKGMLIGFVGEVAGTNISAEMDLTNTITDPTKIKLAGDVNYKLVGYKIGVSGDYNFATGDLSLEPYIAMKLGNADGKLRVRFEEDGYKYTQFTVGFNF